MFSYFVLNRSPNLRANRARRASLLSRANGGCIVPDYTSFLPASQCFYEASALRRMSFYTDLEGLLVRPTGPSLLLPPVL